MNARILVGDDSRHLLTRRTLLPSLPSPKHRSAVRARSQLLRPSPPFERATTPHFGLKRGVGYGRQIPTWVPIGHLIQIAAAIAKISTTPQIQLVQTMRLCEMFGPPLSILA